MNSTIDVLILIFKFHFFPTITFLGYAVCPLVLKIIHLTFHILQRFLHQDKNSKESLSLIAYLILVVREKYCI